MSTTNLNSPGFTSAQLLLDEIQKIQSSKKGTDEKEQEISNAITTSSVSNIKEDIIDFLTLAASNSIMKAGLWGSITGRIMIITSIWVVILFYGDIFIEDEGTYYGIWLLGIILFGPTLGIIYTADKETLEWNKRARIWRAKFDQVLLKGRSLYIDDENFQRQLDHYEQMVKK